MTALPPPDGCYKRSGPPIHNEALTPQGKTFGGGAFGRLGEVLRQRPHSGIRALVR